MTRVIYNWQETLTGRRGLCQIMRYVYTKATDAQLLKNSPADFGISGEEMRKYVLDRLPELEADHRAKTGRELTAKKMMGRFYNMYEINVAGDRVPSGEHPTRHPDLQLIWNQAEMFPEEA